MSNKKYKHVTYNRTDDDKKSKLCRFGYVDYIVVASTLAVAIAEELNTIDLSILSTFFAVLADELALIGSIKNCPSSNNDTSDEVFVPPVPDVAITRSSKKSIKRKKIKTKSKKEKKT